MIEIERTFLIRTLQGYISDLPTHLRIRQIGDEFELTKKGMVGDNVSVQNEATIMLVAEEFERLWPTVQKSFEKTRYFVPLANDLTAEVDVFGGDLTGLVTVDVEFESEQDMAAFVPPDWFGRDITAEEVSSGCFLAGKSFGQIKDLL